MSAATLSRSSDRSPGLSVFTLAALVAFCFQLYNYFYDVGTNGTIGAGLALFGCFALTLAGVVLMAKRHGFIHGLFVVLTILGMIGTLAAAYFLHAWIVLALLAVAALAFLLSLFR